jgi:hypothetical protein
MKLVRRLGNSPPQGFPSSGFFLAEETAMNGKSIKEVRQNETIEADRFGSACLYSLSR